MAPIAGLAHHCIDRWEPFLVEIVRGGERPFSPFENPGNRTTRAKSAPGAVPQAYISRDEAARSCGLAGKHLCSEEEWMNACRGQRHDGQRRAFPYGNDRRLGTCNDDRATNAALDDLARGDKSESDTESDSERLKNPCVNQQPHTVLRTGAKPACATPERVYDLVGNVHEWTSDGTMRGGFFGDTQKNGNGCAYATSAHDPSYWDYSVGFRCCSG
jgi:formylglycine-generating enzyme required for sulfatase activity